MKDGLVVRVGVRVQGKLLVLVFRVGFSVEFRFQDSLLGLELR